MDVVDRSFLTSEYLYRKTFEGSATSSVLIIEITLGETTRQRYLSGPLGALFRSEDGSSKIRSRDD
jgi:hypothetical protein